MADRYTTRPPAAEWIWMGVTSAHTIVVVESDDAPIKTGLFDATGAPLYRVRERIQIGFVAKPDA